MGSKKNLFIIIISALCLISLTQAQEYRPQFEYSEEEAKLYRMPIKQITPKDGIWTGHVIAYGHYIKPPYKFEIREDTFLFVNNVQIYPTLISKVSIAWEEELEKRALETYKRSGVYMDRVEYLFDLARSVYREITLNKSRSAAIDSLYSIFKNDTLLKKILAEITITPIGESDATLCLDLHLPGYGGPDNIPAPVMTTFYLNPPEPPFLMPKTEEERIALAKEWVEKLVKEYEEGLKRGEILEVSSFRRIPCTYGSGRRILQMVKILRSSQNFEEKCLKLKQLHVVDEKEILYNYTSKEWPTLEDLKQWEDK